MVRFIFQDIPVPPADELIPKKADPSKMVEALKRADELLQRFSDNDAENEERFRALAEELGMKLADLLMPLRVAVTGSRVSPPLFASIRLVGIARSRARVAGAIEELEKRTRS